MVTCLPIRIGWARNVAKPVVEQDIVLSHRTIYGYHALGEVLEDIGSTSQVICAIRDFLFYDEAQHTFFLLDFLGRP